jgi:AP-2 complex subunit alpha
MLTFASTSKAFVKKKAALTLLRLYRKYPGIVRNEWAERIISIMDDPDMGVTLSVTSLVMALAQDLPEEYKGCYVKAAQRLKRIVVDNDIAPDYLYYRVPCPWIQVKFLRLLQYYPPSGMFGPLYNCHPITHIYLRGQPCSRDNQGIPVADDASSHGNT